MDKLSSEPQLLSTRDNVRTPNPSSSDSIGNGSTESLLSDINEVRSTPTTLIPEQKESPSIEARSDSSSPISLKKRLSSVPPRLQDLVPPRPTSKDIFVHFQPQRPIDEADETDLLGGSEFSENHTTSTAPDPRTSKARARRRAKMYFSSPERSFKGTSSEEGQNSQEILKNFSDSQSKIRQLRCSETLIPARNTKSDRLLTHSLQQDERKSLKKIGQKFPRLLEPLDITLKRRRRRKNEVLTSSYSTSPEATQRSTFGSLVPYLNLQSWSSDRSATPTTRNERERRDLDIDELVETLSTISLNPSVQNGGKIGKLLPKSERHLSSCGYKHDLEINPDGRREEALKTFRVDKTNFLSSQISHKESSQSPWDLKSSNAVTDLISRRSEASICPFNSHSNASTQVNMKSSASAPKEPRHLELQRMSQERCPFTISEMSSVPGRIHDEHQQDDHHHRQPDQAIGDPSLQVSAAEVIYENHNYGTSSSESSKNSSAAKNIESEVKVISVSKPVRKYERDDRWVQSVSYLPTNGIAHSQDQFSVFFLKDSQVQSVFPWNQEYQPCVHKATCRHVETSKLSPGAAEAPSEDFAEDADFEFTDECLCLKFCNLFRKRSEMMRE